MDIHKYSGIARPIRLSEKTNLLISLLSLFTLLATTGVLYYRSSLGLGEATFGGINYGLAVFLCWAIGRELDPDRPKTAFAGVGLMLVPLFLWLPRVEIILLLTLLFLLRLLNRSPGTPIKPLDILLLIALIGWLFYLGHWIIGLAGIIAFWFNSKLPEPQPWHKFIAVLIALLIIISSYLRPFIVPPGYLSPGITILVVALSTAFALYMRQLKELKSTGDADFNPLFLKRVKVAQLLALLMAVIFTLWNGNRAILSLLPLWAAISGIGFWNIFTVQKTTADKKSGKQHHHHHR